MSFINQCVIAKLTRLIAQSWSTIKQLETEKREFSFINFLGQKSVMFDNTCIHKKNSIWVKMFST